jgi:hypothetical protein
MSNEELAGLIQRLSEQSIRTEDKLEKLVQNLEPKVQFGQRQQARGPPLPDECQVGAFGGPSPTVAVRPAPATSQDLQALAKSVTEMYRSVSLDENHRLHDGRAGIQRSDHKTLNIISQCGRYIETELKIIQRASETDGSLSDQSAGELYTLISASLAFLQDGYGCLFVGAMGDERTAQICRTLRKNASGLPNDAINDLRCAARPSVRQLSSSGAPEAWSEQLPW